MEQFLLSVDSSNFDYLFDHVSKIAFKFWKIIAAAADTDIFATLLSHSQQWIKENLQQLWIVLGQRVPDIVLPIRQIADTLESDVINNL